MCRAQVAPALVFLLIFILRSARVRGLEKSIAASEPVGSVHLLTELREDAVASLNIKPKSTARFLPLSSGSGRNKLKI